MYVYWLRWCCVLWKKLWRALWNLYCHMSFNIMMYLRRLMFIVSVGVSANNVCIKALSAWTCAGSYRGAWVQNQRSPAHVVRFSILVMRLPQASSESSSFVRKQFIQKEIVGYDVFEALQRTQGSINITPPWSWCVVMLKVLLYEIYVWTFSPSLISCLSFPGSLLSQQVEPVPASSTIRVMTSK